MVSQISFSLVWKRTEIFISSLLLQGLCKNLLLLSSGLLLLLENYNTSKPGGGIPFYKLYGCVPLILKGKGFSVPVAHPHPASHRVPPCLTHVMTSTVSRVPGPFFPVYSINQMMTSSVKKESSYDKVHNVVVHLQCYMYCSTG